MLVKVLPLLLCFAYCIDLREFFGERSLGIMRPRYRRLPREEKKFRDEDEDEDVSEIVEEHEEFSSISGDSALDEDSSSAVPSMSGQVSLQLLSTHDWHGSLEPAEVGLGGAAHLSSYWTADSQRYCSDCTLRLMAGDSFGATAALSSLNSELPAVDAQRMLHIDADTLGSHNFDAGVEHTRQMTQRAAEAQGVVVGKPFAYVCANLAGKEKELPLVKDYVVIPMANGAIKMCVVGVINDDAQQMLSQKALGSMKVLPAASEAMRAQRECREKEKADLVIVLVHMGVMESPKSKAEKNADKRMTLLNGPLKDFASNVSGFDVILGDHTGVQWTERINGQVVLETLSHGRSYARTRLMWDTRSKRIVSSHVDFVAPNASAVLPDAEMMLMMDKYRVQLIPQMSRVLAWVPVAMHREGNCIPNTAGACESISGSLIADALRANVTGADFAVTNTGGIRSSFTCQDRAGAGFCPNNSTRNAPFAITVGTVRNVLPFDNIVVSARVSGEMLKNVLERSVRSDVAHVSGMCYTFQRDAPVGKRIVRVVRQKDDGSCSDKEIDLSSSSSYLLAASDYVAQASKMNLAPDYKTLDNMRDGVIQYIQSNTFKLAPIQGRITCLGDSCLKPKGPTSFQ